MKHLLETLLELLIGILVLAIASLVSKQILKILLISIVCTAGVGLIFWIPLAILIGRSVLKISYLFSTNLENEEENTTSEITTLINFIQQGQQQGYKKEVIYKKLIGVGWEKIYIDEAYKFIKN